VNLASYRIGSEFSYGIVTGDGIIDLGRRLRACGLKELIAQDLDLARVFADACPDLATDSVEWLPPISEPTHIIGVGLNTRSHLAEVASLSSPNPVETPDRPRLFMRSPLSHVGHLQPIRTPACSTQLDYEGEIALIIGRRCHGVSDRVALDYIAGVACYNDGSVRDFQQGTSHVTAGKNFMASGAFGPWVTDLDGAGDLSRLTLQTRVNGELRQVMKPDDLIFSYGRLVSYISTIFALQPGDVIVTGTPDGVGAVRGTFLTEGDVVEVEISNVGVLRNPVASGSCARDTTAGMEQAPARW
jgi:2-keto-4-pentenoate hydratase/2-oxohepta-3-ene-1,7-dioic acid hydratase in catechol pathway